MYPGSLLRVFLTVSQEAGVQTETMVPLRNQSLEQLKQLESGAGHQKGESCAEMEVQNSEFGFPMSP